MAGPNVRITNGANGTITGSTDTYTPPSGSVIRGIQTLTETEFGTCTDAQAVSGTIEGLTIAAGIYMEGRWTSVEVVTGDVRLYLEPA